MRQIARQYVVSPVQTDTRQHRLGRRVTGVRRPFQELHRARQITKALMLGGGIPIEAGGSIVGGVGISGAPSGEADDECGRAGIAAVSADLEF